MKYLTLILLFTSVYSIAQNKAEEKEQLLATKKASNFVYEANNLITKDDYISAEKEYRKALSEQPTNVAGAYNLANAYYNKGNYDEALYRQSEAAKNATTKAEKHKAFHNIGNILMQNKHCKEAVEAYKNALRNDPTDDETRYNLGLAKECAEQQKDQNKDDKKDKDQKDQNKDKQDQDKNQQDQNKDQKDQNKDKGDDQKDNQGNPKDDKKDKGKGDKKRDQQQKPQQGQMSPQQIKNLLEAMNNQEQKVQEKINAEKQKGVKIKTEKDW